MGADFDARLTNLAAGVLRDAVRAYDPTGSERALVGFNPVFDATRAVPAAAGSFPPVTGSLPALTGAWRTPAAGAFRAVTGSFRAITESFRAIGTEPAEPLVTLRGVFQLPGTLPGLWLPPEPELAALARSAPTMAALGGLARWLGTDGRPVTDAGEPADGDAADACQRLGIRTGSLSFLWEYALTAGWFELTDSADGRRRRAVTGDTAWRWAHGDDRGALHVWAAVFAAVAERTLGVMAEAAPDAARRLNFHGQGAALAVRLFLARRSGMTTREVEDLVRDGAIGDRPASRLRRAWDAWVREHGNPAHRLLAQLAALHAVTLPPTQREAVRLTPLASWALREQFALDRITVPLLPSPSPQMPGAHLIRLADAVSDAEFDAAFAAWLSGRDPVQAAEELFIYAASSDPYGRSRAVAIVRRIGPPARRAWHDATRRAELAGYARVTLSMMAGEPPEPSLRLAFKQHPEDMTWMTVDLLAITCAAQDPDPDEIAARFAGAVPAGEEARVLGLMAQSPHRDAARVLNVLGGYHPDRRVARKARRALRAMMRYRGPVSGRRLPRVAGV